ncbi:helix-turn-helix domain-containing protein [Paenibacillus xylanexedens]|uniref:helix-turn-helix domain-containing protein n=1 Tax=Paenibacillus xylanexedens TaxID=528191 RepID=UPI001642592C|nr:helix-turn-helix transcriptional regulator [Paenibacillus xylanexedens]
MIKEFDLLFIKERRKEMGKTLQDMADSLDLKNASTYMKYENGEYLFRAVHLPLLAEQLKCEVGNFFAKNFAKTAK